MPSIFLSHSRKDKFFARELAERLQHYGVKVWFDEAEIKIGDSLTQKIGQAIDETDFVGVVLSTNSVNSEWVQKELQAAIQKEFAERKVVVLPLLLEPVEIPPFLRDKLYADFTTPDKFGETFPLLLKALGVSRERFEPTREPQQEPIIRPKLSPARKQLITFEDIQIVDLDEKQTYKPDDQKLLYNMYLKLSRNPPTEWQQIFEAERRFPRHTMWRRAWTEGQYIVIYCVPDELEEYHLNDLTEDVKNSNAKYRQYLMESARKETKERDREQEEREQIRDLKRRLGFD